MYIKRHAEAALKELTEMFGAVLVSGARQVGKTTLLRETFKSYAYVTLDDHIELQHAINEAGTFFKESKPPLIIDEIQYAPSLFPYVKMFVDDTGKKGQILMSGSQQFHLMKNVSESLAGRLGILTLSGVSLRELSGDACRLSFLPTDDYYENRKAGAKERSDISYDEVWRFIHRGYMPELNANEKIPCESYYSAYLKTYIERDVRDLAQVGNERLFASFMSAAAARTGQMLNVTSLANDVGVSAPTAERWLSILVTSNIAYLLKPFHVNATKRVVKTPKLYFVDTGLAAYLTNWGNAETLRSGAAAGAFFETFVVSEILKSYWNAGKEPPLYYYRDGNGKEIDILIWRDGKLHPIEIKKHANPSARDISAFNAADNFAGVERGPGGVICMYDKLLTLRGNDKIIPVSYL